MEPMSRQQAEQAISPESKVSKDSLSALRKFDFKRYDGIYDLPSYTRIEEEDVDSLGERTAEFSKLRRSLNNAFEEAGTEVSLEVWDKGAITDHVDYISLCFGLEEEGARGANLAYRALGVSGYRFVKNKKGHRKKENVPILLIKDGDLSHPVMTFTPDGRVENSLEDAVEKDLTTHEDIELLRRTVTMAIDLSYIETQRVSDEKSARRNKLGRRLGGIALAAIVGVGTVTVGMPAFENWNDARVENNRIENIEKAEQEEERIAEEQAAQLRFDREYASFDTESSGKFRDSEISVAEIGSPVLAEVATPEEGLVMDRVPVYFQEGVSEEYSADLNNWRRVEYNSSHGNCTTLVVSSEYRIGADDEFIFMVDGGEQQLTSVIVDAVNQRIGICNKGDMTIGGHQDTVDPNTLIFKRVAADN